MVKKSILVVEDDDAIRESLKEILADEGYPVQVAANGREALDLLSALGSEAPGLILLDLTMPVMNGTEFLEHQKKDPLLKAIPSVVFTAAGGKPKPPLADGFLKKPIQLDALLDLVQQYCA